jgi:hypothetical protein
VKTRLLRREAAEIRRQERDEKRQRRRQHRAERRARRAFTSHPSSPHAAPSSCDVYDANALGETPMADRDKGKDKGKEVRTPDPKHNGSTPAVDDPHFQRMPKTT